MAGEPAPGRGRLAGTPTEGETVPATQLKGSYQTQRNAANMSNGIYLYNIKVNNKRFNGKMVKI